ncbi:MAG: GWxTD domain-containing protein [Flavobacteriales bacterium]|nr:GWxTD domain-containing protein [Flavobacteriales bacterium]
MNIRASILPVILLAAVLAGCSSSAPLSKRDNFAYLYGKSGAQMPLQARVHHLSSDHSRVYYKLNTKDLLYKSDGSGGPFHAVVRISYESYDAFGSSALLDSASTIIDDETNEPGEDKELIGSMDLRRKEQRSFILKIMARDLNRDQQSTVFLRVDKDGISDRQYFMPVDTAHGLPFFSDHFKAGRVRVRCETCAGRTLTVTHHPANSTMPAPVFNTASTAKSPSARIDSTFHVSVNADGLFTMDLTLPGSYRIGADSLSENGYYLHSVAEAYPLVVTPDDLLKPLRYITSNQEYDRLAKSPDVRQAVERFWIDAAGDRERGREAIRIYYGRVENANRHFTAEAEGWRTDRGLVHIIFGVPTSIYKTDLAETWIYGEENNLMSLTFTFKRRNGTFIDNDMVLERDPLLKGAWYRNVESWRNGRVYQN